MRESKFIEQNEADWRQLELILDEGKIADADEIGRLFEKVSGDLAYARTYYPNRSIRVYLNDLTQKVLDKFVKKKRPFRPKDIVDFYRKTLPYEIYKERHAFITSFVIFLLAFVIGWLSSVYVPEFTNLILGDSYVDKTMGNINDGDPMRIYKDKYKGGMFMHITLNNIKVSFNTYILGILGGVGTVYILLLNGIMVGTFQYFFYSKGLFLTSFLTIWCHGTIEISAIILAGAAGLILGKGLLFPKTLSRTASLVLSAKKSLTIILSLVPLFVIAGFLESFVTRLTWLPIFAKALIIIFSLAFILSVYVFNPIIRARKGLYAESDTVVEPPIIENVSIKKNSYHSFTAIIAGALALYRKNLGKYLQHFLLPMTILYALVTFSVFKWKVITGSNLFMNLTQLEWVLNSPALLILHLLWLSWFFIFMIMMEKNEIFSWDRILINIKMHFLKILPFTLLFMPYIFIGWHWVSFFFLMIPIPFIFHSVDRIGSTRSFDLRQIGTDFRFTISYWFNFILTYGILWNYALLVFLIMNSAVVSLFNGLLSWHQFTGDPAMDNMMIIEITRFVLLVLFLPFFYYLYTYHFSSLESLVKAKDLKLRLENFGVHLR